jgi:hypothetical protein
VHMVDVRAALTQLQSLAMGRTSIPGRGHRSIGERAGLAQLTLDLLLLLLLLSECLNGEGL